ncbi:MAG: hypothetical protein ACFFAZ_16925 [Promethearchaeota archaeon]
MNNQFIATIRQLSTESKGITIPKAIADLYTAGTKVKITMEALTDE